MIVKDTPEFSLRVTMDRNLNLMPHVLSSNFGRRERPTPFKGGDFGGGSVIFRGIVWGGFFFFFLRGGAY